MTALAVLAGATLAVALDHLQARLRLRLRWRVRWLALRWGLVRLQPPASTLSFDCTAPSARLRARVGRRRIRIVER